jgi:hypothetical protein
VFSPGRQTRRGEAWDQINILGLFDANDERLSALGDCFQPFYFALSALSIRHPRA